MKNKGMHKQPGAFTPSTGGGNAPQGNVLNKGGFGGQHQGHGHQQPQSWQRPQTPAAQPAVAPTAARDSKNLKKGKKAA